MPVGSLGDLLLTCLFMSLYVISHIFLACSVSSFSRDFRHYDIGFLA